MFQILKERKVAKTTTYLLLTLFVISIITAIDIQPTVSGHTPPKTIATYAYISISPNPVGIGQTIRILMWLDQTINGGTIDNDIRFHNYRLTITKPDYTTETKTWDTVWDTTSSQGYSYIPDQLGTYTFKFEFPGQDYNAYSHDIASAYVNDTYAMSSSSTTLIVQQEQIPFKGSYSLPTEYWTRPIYGENTAWWSISSDWLGTGSPEFPPASTGSERYAHDVIGPLTSHIMWTKPLQSGGIAGGDNYAIQGDTYSDGTSRMTRYSNPIIMAGKIFFTEPVFMMGSSGPTDCVDLRTGKLIWSRTDVPALSFGSTYAVHTVNTQGVIQPILYTSNFARAFDADTGDPLYNVTNVPSGTAVMGPNGEILRYTMTNTGTSQNPKWYLAEWNSSKLWDFGQSIGYSNMTGSTVSMTGGILPGNIIIDGGVADPKSSKYRYDWNVSIPWLDVMGNETWVTLADLTQYKGYTNTGQRPTGNPDASNPVNVVCAFLNDVMICRNGSLPTSGLALSGISTTPYTYFAVNLNSSKGAIGSILWMKTYDPPADNINVFPGGFSQASRIFVEYYKQTAQWVAYSMETGARLWTTASQTDFNALEYYGSIRSSAAVAQFAYGKLYSSGFGGVCFCYNLKNGELLWTYGNGGEGNSTNAGFSAGGEVYYPMFIDTIANGVVYLETSEHTVQTPIYPGSLKRAINATDGTELWTLSSYSSGGGGFFAFAFADGFETWFNGYDNQIYTVGRGPSTTTVTAPEIAVTFGQGVVIRGSVMDISSGTTQSQQAARFPNGVPCAADSSMKNWMEYVYQQKPIPNDFTGVPVLLYVLDSNANYRQIGTTTTNANGKYTFTWMPDIPGDYTVYATFAGTKGYWPSTDTTSFTVAETAQTTSPIPLAALPPTEMYFIMSTFAIIIAIAVIGTVIILVLKKRP
jgi:outer membrane protein assembly factor BamB